MVYCGKPSKGCSKCRERKIRCDQGEPSCGQCEKRHQTCPGYRNLVDLMFRDESSHVINKAAKTRSRAARKKAQTPGPTSPSPSPRPVPSAPVPSASTKPVTKKSASRRRGPVLSILTPRSSSSPSQASTDSNDGDAATGDYCLHDLYSDQVLLDEPLPESLQERGTAFFWSRYVAADNGCHQNFSFIYDVWKPPDTDDAKVDAVRVSMAAVGLAGLSQLTGCKETMHRARQSYGIALKLTNTALCNPEECIKDTTLLAVLILGRYEFVAGHSPQTMQAWQDHVNGAAILAGMRGSAQFRTKAGVSMFLMLSQSVLISCIQSGLPMPQAMVDLRNELQPSLELDSPVWRVVDPVYRALQVRYDIKSGKLHDIDDIVEKLTHIDDEFAVILSKLPPSWNYRRIQLTRSDPRVFGHWCHVYPGLLQATMWNGVRAVRMLVLETILEQLCCGSKPLDLASLPDHYRTRLARITKLLSLLGEAIVASIPQHFGVVSFRQGSSTGGTGVAVSSPTKEQRYRDMPIPAGPKLRSDHGLESEGESSRPTLLNPTNSVGQEGNAERFMTLASASHTIIWPLYILGMSSTCSTETKQYAIDRLHAIHRETGLEQARIVAKLLETREEPAKQGASLFGAMPPLPEGMLPDVV
ncbi:hypothetical protein AK830_g314 [Neonectria ditissima]|uniref:Zn(2)-C6 fungal-type domain-containing protein n=1 Tax=Neonectria ditissima TaxID=78410 RepID=A0A0P7BQC6_9HYPO|nr:hypothetical protein AK830_g314 [Neonectria ditissima]